jgi:hypothetical protein
VNKCHYNKREKMAWEVKSGSEGEASDEAGRREWPNTMGTPRSF